MVIQQNQIIHFNNLSEGIRENSAFKLDVGSYLAPNLSNEAEPLIHTFYFQMRVRVADGGTPPKTATAVLTINIDYNLNSPVFHSSSVCSGTISENQDPAEVFGSVLAEDADTKVC